MGQALYRKYRSKSLSEIVGQDHIITTLQNALESGAISHAYLFTGPRGVGKTSIARILAHEINQLPYSDEAIHIDIIEIDAASNRRIDEIRDLRDKVHIAPTTAKYKVYIIDEVHMLTREAFNALLKTLEEPPAHVIFILATTEVHKLPETIISRTQRFTFRPIENTKAVAHLRDIAKKEKITISDDALELIATHGDGSFRDSISLLDQMSNMDEKIEADTIRRMLGIAPQKAIIELYQQVMGGTLQGLLEQLQDLWDQGYESTHIARQLSRYIRQELIEGRAAGKNSSKLLKELLEVPVSSDPVTKLELTLLDAQETERGSTETPAKPAATVVAPTPQISQPARKVQQAQQKTEEQKPTPQKAPSVPLSKDFVTIWQNCLDAVKTQYNTLYGVLRMAEPRYDDQQQKLVLAFQFAFHQKRLNDAKNRTLVADILQQQLGKTVEISCTVDKNANPNLTTIDSSNEPTLDAVPKPETAATDPLATISNIFGAAEVLES